MSDKLFRNEGLYIRSRYTASGRIVTIEGPLHCDICRQERYLLNAVDVRFKLYPSSNAFRLITNDDEKYKVKIIDAYLRVRKITVSPEVILGHSETLKTNPALYPHYKTVLKPYTFPKGQFTVNIDQPFEPVIPSKLCLYGQL